MDPVPVEDISEREEGEIIEDELEDVSDCSLTTGSPLDPGKSVTASDFINGVCLSKNSHPTRDNSFISYGNKKHGRMRRKKRNSHDEICKKSQSKPRRSSIIEVLSNSDDEMTDPRYAKQLREALCRESTEASTNNNLKTRLRALIDNTSHSEDEASLKDLREFALSTSPKLDSDNPDITTNRSADSSIDSELQELRLEALKSVMLNNHERRKRKLNQNVSSLENNGRTMKDTDKENDQSIINNKKMKIEGELEPEIDSNLPAVDSESAQENYEEDADILRAVLLASMTKKLPKTTMLPKKPLEFPKIVVKPLIICLNSDSDSDDDDEFGTSPVKTTLSSNVTDFLKKQRAESEASVKKELNPPISDYSKQNNTNVSAVKLLPQEKQLEYRRLQKYLNAHKRGKVRRNSLRSLHHSKNDINTTNSTKKLPSLVNSVSKAPTVLTNKPVNKVSTALTNNDRKPVVKVSNNGMKKAQSTINHLNKTLDDLQTTKNGRLQMKGKYQSLVPLLNNIKKASSERQQQETLIKKLLQEIQIARTKFAASSQLFTNQVQELVKAKQSIDQRETLPVSAVINEEPQLLKKNAESATELNPECVPNNSATVITSDNLNLPLYRSPLDHRQFSNDPVLSICSHDLLGVCKDKECPYTHYS